MTVITVEVETTVDLSVGEVWPDGNAPHNPTAEDVARLLESLGSKEAVLREWCIDLAVTVTTTTPNPHYSGPDSLPGMKPFTHTTAEAWD